MKGARERKKKIEVTPEQRKDFPGQLTRLRYLVEPVAPVHVRTGFCSVQLVFQVRIVVLAPYQVMHVR